VSAVKSIKSISAIRALIVAGAVVLGLAVSTGQLTAATVTVGTPSGDDYAAMVRQPSTVATTIYEDSRPDVFARHGKARDAFGFPVGSKRAGRHVHDGYQNLDYDEVSEVDSAGKTVSMTQFGLDGQLVAAMRFDTQPVQLTRATGDAAVRAALRSLTSVGMQVGGDARATENDISGGWDVSWHRVEDGIAVRGDETRVHVWHDGRIQSAARVAHQLAAAPGGRLGQTEARQAVDRQMNAWLTDKQSGYSVGAMDVQWVGPNAAFDPSKLNAAPAPYRMAWVVNVKPSGAAVDYVQLITLFIDAGDGSIIGGDVVE
jgi:hypothetical protein